DVQLRVGEVAVPGREIGRGRAVRLGVQVGREPLLRAAGGVAGPLRDGRERIQVIVDQRLPRQRDTATELTDLVFVEPVSQARSRVLRLLRDLIEDRLAAIERETLDAAEVPDPAGL